jgi:hypothetical protein
LKRATRVLASAAPSQPDADLQASAAQLVLRAEALRQVDRAAQAGQDHGAAQPQALGDGRRVGQHVQRVEEGHRAEDGLARPGAVEAQRLGAPQVGAKGRRVEGAVGIGLWDRDRKACL